MVTVRNFLVVLFQLILFTHCNSKKDNGNKTAFSSPLGSPQMISPLLGKWKYSNTIWYSSELTLYNNGTFTFHDQACLGQRFSEGQWISTNGSIFLTSFDSFRQKEEVTPIQTVEIVKQRKTNYKIKSGKIEYSFADIKVFTSPRMTQSSDTVRIYLDKEQLRLIDDTLVCIGFNKLLEGTRFFRTQTMY